MKKQLRYSRKAVADLDSIWAYTEQQWGADQARSYTRAIHGECLRLLGGEIVASRHSFRGATFLRLRTGMYVVYLVEEEAALLVVRILHVRQDIDNELV